MRIKMREQEAEKRVRNFDSVPLGYAAEEAIAEAGRCLQCQEPGCENNCPVNLKIKSMTKHIADGNFSKAFLIARQDNPIPAIAGRVCPQETQCEGACLLGKNAINIGKLEAFLGDWALENKVAEKLSSKQRRESVAVVGSGPAAISCAVDLRRLGYQVTVFEALHTAGGVLQYGIPDFRLPKDVVDNELLFLAQLGVDLKLNSVVGQNVMFGELRANFDAVFLATGAGAPVFLGIEGEHLNGVYSANEFLIRVNLMKAHRFPEYDTPIVVGKRVAVIGAGNVAMDAARCAVRLGAESVCVLYRRTLACCPARQEELRHGLEEGIQFVELVAPLRIIGSEGWVKAIELVRMRLGANDSSNRPKPEPVEGSNFSMEFDTIINAIGNRPNRLFLDRVPELRTNASGAIIVDKELMTSLSGVFAGGDAISGGETVIQSLGDGRKAAASINRYLSRKNL
jgi:glutamate synthase (NADPH/NADH) small chain